jgi:hypothetical protein
MLLMFLNFKISIDLLLIKILARIYCLEVLEFLLSRLKTLIIFSFVLIFVLELFWKLFYLELEE